jgi:hypothetical protein
LVESLFRRQLQCYYSNTLILGNKYEQTQLNIMPSAVSLIENTPIPLKISDDGMTVAYDDATAWNVTAAPAVVSLASTHHPTLR